MKKPYADRLRKNILELVRQRGLTVEKLGIESELSKTFLSQVVLGQSSISLASLKKLADALGVDIVDLVKP